MNGWLPSLAIAAVAAAGALGGGIVACLPGFHVYSVLGLGFLCLSAPVQGFASDLTLVGVTAAVTAWVIVSAIPAILLSAPDESAVFAVLPGQRYLLQGRGLEAIQLTALGSAGALVILAPLGGLLAPVLPTLHRILGPHYHWILWVVITFMLLSEWPQGRTAGLSTGRRLWSGLRNVAAGLATFLLAGLLGLILFIRSPLPLASAAQGLMPAFAGLFAVPWLLLNIVSRVRIPPQRRSSGAMPDLPSLLHGWAAGLLGGAFAAFIPVVSGGVGSLLAGHALSTRNERTFLVGQGACRAVYYTGGLLLLFLPGGGVARGGAAAMLRGVHTVRPGDMTLALAAAGIAAALALWGIGPLTRLTLRLLERHGCRRVSLAALALLAALVAGAGGPAGLAVAAVATGIGLLPALFGARRLNALGVVLLPMACAMSGGMPLVTRLLGLAPS
jgi:putative membrane protein